MAREDNLIKGGKAHKLTVDEQSTGGKKSAEVRRQKRDLRKVLETFLSQDFMDKKTGESKTGAELIAFKQFKKALEGDTKAFEVVRDTAGQKPIDRIQIAEIDADIMNEVDMMVNQAEAETGAGEANNAIQKTGD